MHGHKWWEFDLTWLTLRGLMALGLATDVKHVYPPIHLPRIRAAAPPLHRLPKSASLPAARNGRERTGGYAWVS